MTLIVHHLQNSRSQRILWMLEELGLPYAVKRYERNPKTLRADPALRDVHPLGRAPLLQDDEHVIAETGAIIEYLNDLSDSELAPPPHRATVLRYRHFLHYAEGSLMPPLMALLVVGRLGLLGRPARKPLLGMMVEHFRWLDSELTNRPYFTGDRFTAADIMMSFPLEASRSRAGLDSRYPHVLDWLDRMHARPAYQAALAKGGPYAYA